MKTLIFPLIFFSFSVFSQEMTDTEIKNRFASTVKDAEVEKMLGQTAEFNECRDKNKFDAANVLDQTKIDNAIKCFQDKLKGRDAKSLQKLSENLQLESYGLVKSKNVADITDYLAGKLEKALTGVDPNEKDINKIKESLKFKNRKMVDQKVFIELYVNQLGKSALQEVSRFCFENLRNTSKPQATNFNDHWTGFDLSSSKVEADIKAKTIVDNGDPEFAILNSNTDASKKEDVQGAIIQGITSSDLDPTLLENYFGYCQKSIKLLCDEFKKGSLDASKANKVNKETDLSTGSNACLTMNRLQSIRSAMANTKLVIAQLEKQEGEDKSTAINLMFSDPVKLYERGKGAEEESLDDLTNIASSDLLEKQSSDQIDQATECAQNPSQKGCEEYLVVGDDLDNAIHNVENEANLKREIELERVRKMANNKDDLKKYLEDNGYFDLLKDFEQGKATPKDIEDAVEKNYDAKKVATIEALRLKVGKRQMTEDQVNTLGDQGKTDQLKKNAQESLEERARLAQVVMFNNIITSHLELQKDNNGKRETIGRNVNAWKKEAEGLDKNQIQTQYFDQIKEEVKNSGSVNTQDTSIVDVGIIDSILGKED